MVHMCLLWAWSVFGGIFWTCDKYDKIRQSECKYDKIRQSECKYDNQYFTLFILWTFLQSIF